MNTFLQIAIVGLLGAVSPGPDFAIVTRNSIRYGSLGGVYSAFGIFVGLLTQGMITAAGISLLIVSYPLLFTAIKVAGAAYLIYLGIKSLRAFFKNRFAKSLSVNGEIAEEEKTESPSALFRMGLFTNLLNPKLSLFLLGLFSQMLTPQTPSFLRCLYVIELSLIALIWFCTLSFVIGKQEILSRLRSYQVYVDGVLGAVLVIIGVLIVI